MVSTPPVLALNATSATLLCPANTALSVPSTASLANAALKNAINVRHPIPKNFVTGSMNVPTLYRRLLSTLPEELYENAQKTSDTSVTVLIARLNMS